MKSKGIWKSRSETTDSQSAFLASTCALTIGLNLGWLTNQKNITETDRLDQEMVFYVAAVPCAYFCGRDMHKVGPYRIMVAAVCASVLTGGTVALVGPCSSAVCLYSSRALQGMASALLAVSVPIFVVESAKGLYQNAMLCLIEVFTLTGILISHSLNLFMTDNARMNILMTAVVSLNVLALILIRVKSGDNQRKIYRYHCRTAPGLIGFPNDPEVPERPEPTGYPSVALAILFTDKKLRNGIFVSISLFVFRDFCGTHLLMKCIRWAFSEIYGPISYEHCTLLVTLFQLIFTIATVIMVETYGKRKLMLISSLGMLLSATSLEIIVWNTNLISTKSFSSYVCFLTVFLAYILFVAHGLSSIPWAIVLDINHQKVRNIATGLIISVHFLFLYIVEFSDINEKDVYTEDSIVVYWFIFVRILQIVFVYNCIFENKKY